MGYPISSNIAHLMEDLKTTLTSKVILKLYKIYVYDLFVIKPENKTTYFKHVQYSYHLKLQFTIEAEKNNTVNYLDLALIKNYNKIITKWDTNKKASGFRKIT